jgi:virginiamycin B lyase
VRLPSSAYRSLRRIVILVLLSGVMAGNLPTAAIGQSASLGTVTEFPIPSGGGPVRITGGPDGALWFTELESGRIGRLTTSGSFSEFTLPSAYRPYDISNGPDGTLWFTGSGTNQIGKISTSGIISQFPIPTTGSQPHGITMGPDGNGWFTEYIGNRIGRITPNGSITEFAIPTPSSSPEGITSGPDGALWFTESIGAIGRITTDGSITEFTLPLQLPYIRFLPSAITSGPDHNLWITGSREACGAGCVSGGVIGRITPTGAVSVFPLPGIQQSIARSITTGPDGHLWFTGISDGFGGTIGGTPVGVIGRIAVDGTMEVSALNISSTTPGIFTVSQTAPSGPEGITLGSDNNLWFADSGTQSIGKLAPGIAGGQLAYVAAGDSVPDGEDLGGCPAGTNCKDKAYPHYIADRLAAALAPAFTVSTQNIACSGFTTSQFRTTSACRGTPYPLGSQLAQAAGVQPDAKLVTLTVGADNLLTFLQNQNNIGCVTISPADPKKCDALLASAMQQVTTDMNVILPDISQHANLVIVTGYYHIYTPPTRPNHGQARTLINGYVDRLDSTIADAVTKLGNHNVVYMDFVSTFAGHEVGSTDPWLAKRVDCQGIPAITDFSNDIQATAQVIFYLVRGDFHAVGCIYMPAVHPNQKGQQAISDAIWTRYGSTIQNSIH